MTRKMPISDVSMMESKKKSSQSKKDTWVYCLIISKTLKIQFVAETIKSKILLF